MKLLTTIRRPVHLSPRGRSTTSVTVRPGGPRPATRPASTRCVPGQRPPLDTEMEMLACTGTAIVIAVEPTDEKVDIGTLYEVTLLVTDKAGHSSWEVRHRQLIAPAALAGWTPGNTLPVRYSPWDPSNVCIGC